MEKNRKAKIMIANCKLIRDQIEKGIYEEIKDAKLKPSLGVFLIGDNPASIAYVRNKEKACVRVGIEFTLYHFNDIDEDDLIHEIKKANDLHDGVMVQLPLSPKFNKDRIINAIEPDVDVDGLTKVNIESSYKYFIPCTARGVLLLLDAYNIKCENEPVVTIIGRSDLIGRPLLHELEQRNFTTIWCNSHTPAEKLKILTKISNVIISAVGNPEFLDTTYFNDYQVIVDCGYSVVDGKAKGDVYWRPFADDASMLVTSTPGGTGILTVTALLENVMISWRRKYEAISSPN